jgi:hypothetical protein
VKGGEYKGRCHIFLSVFSGLYYDGLGWGMRVSCRFPIFKYVYISLEGRLGPWGSARVGGYALSSFSPAGLKAVCLSPLRGLRYFVLLSRVLGAWWTLCGCVASFKTIKSRRGW